MGPCAIANRAHRRGFRAILRNGRKLTDWMVEGAVRRELLSAACQPVDADAAVDMVVVDTMVA